MYILLTIILKELLLLWRDRAGLTVLFIMPAILLLVVSSVQHNVMMTLDRPQIRVLLVDHDNDTVSRQITSFFKNIPSIELIEDIDGHTPDRDEAFDKVAKGEYQFCLFIAEGTSKRFIDSVESANTFYYEGEGEITVDQSNERKSSAGLELYYDPVVQGAWRTAVDQAVKGAIFAIEAREGYRHLVNAISKNFQAPISGNSSQVIGPGQGLSAEFPEESGKESILNFDIKAAMAGNSRKIPNEVQYNIPAWTLFGMFFIVVPLSGALIRERQERTLTRIFTLPVPFLTLLIGKILAYITICLSQCILMFLVGMTILPLQGLPPLELGYAPVALLLVVLSASFAATGFGLMVGAVARTYEQGSMFGAVTVVIGAALGGIMLPVYVMPELMQKLSNLSPFSWGLDAFLEIFIRGGDIRTVFPQSLYLILFGSVTTGMALWAVIREKKINV